MARVAILPACLAALAGVSAPAQANHFNPSDLDFGLHCSPTGWGGGPSSGSTVVPNNGDREFAVGWNRLPSGPVAHIRYTRTGGGSVSIKQDEDDGPADGRMSYALVSSSGLSNFTIDDAEVEFTLRGPNAYVVIAATYTGSRNSAWISWEASHESGSGSFMVQASCLEPVSSQPEPPAPAAPRSVTLSAHETSALADGSQELHYRVTVWDDADGTGDPLPGITVWATHDGEDITYTNSGRNAVTTDSNGEAVFTVVSSTPQSLNFSFTEEQNGHMVRASGTFEELPAAGRELRIASGNGQRSGVQTMLAEPLVVEIRDDDGAPVGGVDVEFSFVQVPAGSSGHSLGSPSATTDAEGRASTTVLLGEGAGLYRVRAASADGSVTFSVHAELDDVDPAAAAFADLADAYMGARMDRILAAEPRRYRLLQRQAMETEPGAFALQASGNDNRMAGAFSMRRRPAISRFDFWAEGQYSRYSDDRIESRRRGEFGIVFAGLDYSADETLRLGVMAHYDWISQRSVDQATELSGAGWMFGPYVSTEVVRGVFVDVRGAYGRSTNTAEFGALTPEDAWRGEFDTDRWLLRVNVAGAWESDAWLITPEASLVYLREQRNGFPISDQAEATIDGIASEDANITVPGRSLGLGRLSAGPEFTYRFTHQGLLVSTFVQPRLLLDLGTAGHEESSSRWRGALEGGIRFGSVFGTVGELSAAYDGLGRSAWKAYSVRLSISLPLPP